MTKDRIIAASMQWVLLSASSLIAGDLSQYRKFQFGMDLSAVVKQVGMKPSDVKVIHARPAVIQELKWQPWQFPASSLEKNSVKEISFKFYNAELFRMTVNYDRDTTEGLTADDLIDAMSATYGTATKPDADILFPSVYNETVKVVARWDDELYSFNLVRSSYGPAFGLVVFSKRVDALAQTAVAEAIRLDEQEAPQREIARNLRQDEEKRVQQEKARVANKGSFRP